MTDIHGSVASLNEAARKIFGPDIHIAVARAPAYGDADVCFVVQGKHQEAVCLDLMRLVRSGKATRTASEFMGRTTHSTILEGQLIARIATDTTPTA